MRYQSRRCSALRRNKRGQVISETGPALFVLFVMILFPLLDLLYMGLAFGIVWYLNYLEVRELAVRIPEETAQVIQEVDGNYVTTGLGRFVGLSTASITHPITGQASRDPVAPPPEEPQYVTCTTQAQVNPFLNLPFVIPVAGINAPVVFTVTSTRLQEERGRD